MFETTMCSNKNPVTMVTNCCNCTTRRGQEGVCTHSLYPRLRECVTGFDLWSFGTRCFQLALLEAYATSPSIPALLCAHTRACLHVILCVCTLAFSVSPSVCLFVFFPYCLCLFIPNLLSATPTCLVCSVSPSLSLIGSELYLLYRSGYFLNNQC